TLFPYTTLFRSDHGHRQLPWLDHDLHTAQRLDLPERHHDGDLPCDRRQREQLGGLHFHGDSQRQPSADGDLSGQHHHDDGGWQLRIGSAELHDHGHRQLPWLDHDLHAAQRLDLPERHHHGDLPCRSHQRRELSGLHFHGDSQRQPSADSDLSGQHYHDDSAWQLRIGSAKLHDHGHQQLPWLDHDLHAAQRLDLPERHHNGDLPCDRPQREQLGGLHLHSGE